MKSKLPALYDRLHASKEWITRNGGSPLAEFCANRVELCVYTDGSYCVAINDIVVGSIRDSNDYEGPEIGPEMLRNIATHTLDLFATELLKAIQESPSSDGKNTGIKTPVNWDDPHADGPVHNAARMITTILTHDEDMQEKPYLDQVKFVLREMKKALAGKK